MYISIMNTRHLLAQESLGAGGDGSNVANSHVRPFLVRLAIRVSRARWYSFLRRVYQYQNGSGSGPDIGPNPFDSRKWMVMVFVALAVQICVVAYTLIVSGGERPAWPMRIWVVGYAFGCLVSLMLLCWRYRLVYLTRGDNLSVVSVEQQRSHQESRKLEYLHKFKSSLELLYAIWFVMGNVWAFDSRLMPYDRAPKLHVLCISLLAWNALCYSFPLILFVLLCCCVPLLSRLLGYNINKGSLDRGATDEQLTGLLSWKYEDAGNNLELGSSAKTGEAPECGICLAKYRDQEEIRQLPCSHIFHLKCVDHWLKIISSCPICKQGI